MFIYYQEILYNMKQTTKTTTHNVYDVRNQKVVGQYSSRKRASNKADKLSNEYGSYNFVVQRI